MQRWYFPVLGMCLLAPAGAALAAEPMPDLEQANAAYRRALQADLAARPEPPSPVAASLLQAMKIDAVQGCQTDDANAGAVACIVAVDAGLRRGYQAYRFSRDGAEWTVLLDPDAAAPAPTLAQAQVLIRRRLGEDGARQSDPALRAQFEQAAAQATVTSLRACELDRDDGTVACDLRLRLPGEEPSARQDFELRGDTWSLPAR